MPLFLETPIYIYIFLRFKVKIVKLGGAFTYCLCSPLFKDNLPSWLVFFGLKRPSNEYRRSWTKHLKKNGVGVVDPFEVGIDGGTGRKISTSPHVWVGGISQTNKNGWHSPYILLKKRTIHVYTVYRYTCTTMLLMDPVNWKSGACWYHPWCSQDFCGWGWCKHLKQDMRGR